MARSELTPRQWSLYNLLKDNPDRRFKQYEIAEALPEHYGLYNPGGDDYYLIERENREHFHDSTARLQITADIRAINRSSVVQKVIVCDRTGVKIASREEFEKHMNSEFAAIFRRLERARQKARKGGLDGQMRLVLGSERDTVEAFSDSINRLRAARLNKGLRLADVVRELSKTEKGIDISLLSKMENGYCAPTQPVLVKMAQIYGVNPSALSGGELVAESKENA